MVTIEGNSKSAERCSTVMEVPVLGTVPRKERPSPLKRMRGPTLRREMPKWDNIHFGISLRNVGPRMRFKGDGLSFRGTVPNTGTSMTVEQRSADFELPSMVTIGGAYDFYFPNDPSAKKMHR